MRLGYNRGCPATEDGAVYRGDDVVVLELKGIRPPGQRLRLVLALGP
jgi:hypothetical protein